MDEPATTEPPTKPPPALDELPPELDEPAPTEPPTKPPERARPDFDRLRGPSPASGLAEEAPGSLTCSIYPTKGEIPMSALIRALATGDRHAFNRWLRERSRSGSSDFEIATFAHRMAGPWLNDHPDQAEASRLRVQLGLLDVQDLPTSGSVS